MLGISSWPTERSIVCQVNELASTGLMRVTIEARRPSAKTPLLTTNHCSPRFVQTASATPPSESNVQERIFLSPASQPITCRPEFSDLPSDCAENERIRKV